MAAPNTMSSYSHLPTHLHSPSLPLLLRTLEPEDNAAFAQILSDPRNTSMESDKVRQTEPMALDVATGVVARMRDSASRPTNVVVDVSGGNSNSSSSGKVVSGPDRVNMAIVYLGDEGTEEGDDLRRKGGLVIGIGGFGSIKDLDPRSGEEVPAASSSSSAAARADFLRVGDVGAMINPEYRGRGFATESVRLAMEWAFRKASDGGLQLDKVTAFTLAENVGMVKVLEKKIAGGGWHGKKNPGAGPGGKDEMEYEMKVEEWNARLRK